MNVQKIASSLLVAATCMGGAAHAQTASVTAPVATTATASAPVAVDSGWARATVPGQKASGAYMRLTAPQATRLVRIETPAAGVSEVHEMQMDGDVMKMRALSGLDLPAGKAVELKSGGNHVMLMDLKAPLVKGASLPLTLVFKNAQGVETSQQVNLPIGTAAPGAKAGSAMGSMSHDMKDRPGMPGMKHGEAKPAHPH